MFFLHCHLMQIILMTERLNIRILQYYISWTRYCEIKFVFMHLICAYYSKRRIKTYIYFYFLITVLFLCCHMPRKCSFTHYRFSPSYFSFILINVSVTFSPYTLKPNSESPAKTFPDAISLFFLSFANITKPDSANYCKELSLIDWCYK